MLYLIGGIPKSGKSLLANDILKRKKIAYFSTDMLMMALNSDKRLNIDANDSDAVVGKNLQPFLIRLLKNIIETTDDYLVEGSHITTDVVQKLLLEYPGLVKACFVGYNSISLVEKSKELKENSDKIKNNWYAHLSSDEYIAFLADAIKESNKLAKKCQKYNLKYFDIYDISNEKDKIFKFLFEEKK